MKKEVIIKDGGQMNQTITTTVAKEPPSVEVGPVKVSHDNMGIVIIGIFVIGIGYILWRKFFWNKKDK